MIWLASFPRSGNTFVRNILFHCYGIQTGAFARDAPKNRGTGYMQYKVVKTHELPEYVIPADASIPVVCIVRDGRDAVVSAAHHRSMIVAPGTPFLDNLVEAIEARDGSYFGGWSRNVLSWLQRAQLVIHFEELVKDPIGCVERMRTLIDLPEPRLEALPTFESQKNAQTRYGNVQRIDGHSQMFFRRGAVGGWKDDMPETLHARFWSLHGKAMELLGYRLDGTLEWEIVKTQPFLKRGHQADQPPASPEAQPHSGRSRLPNVELLSIHIPKTGGTSFEASLQKIYGREHIVRMDLKTGDVLVVNDQTWASGTFIDPKYKVIHGHLLTGYLPNLRQEFGIREQVPMVTWLREPANRVISNYYYLEQRLRAALKGQALELMLLRMQKSLKEFALLPLNQNRMHRFLKGTKLEDFAFVGIMEHYADDLVRLGEIMGWQGVEEHHHNETSYDLSRIDPDVLSTIREMNKYDYDLYNRALELREKRMKVI